MTGLFNFKLKQYIVLLLSMLMFRCVSASPGHIEPDFDFSNKSNLLKLEQRLRLEVRQWKGTPHKWGGTDKRGVDCSGFVQRLYQDVFSYRIPRSTRLQSIHGKYLKKSQLLPGDAVFFKISGEGRHVGIYLGQNEFAHASSSKGVTVASLTKSYWQKHYWMSRRFLNH
ncbi:MAG: NlpC/P60 family protein [Desulfobacteraceae bacterium]|jgi:cell wall-associated NlpC family hydrolase